MRDTESEGIWNTEPILFTVVLGFLFKIVFFTPKTCWQCQDSVLQRASWANVILGILLLVAVGAWGSTFYTLCHLEFIAATICFTTSCFVSLVVQGLMLLGIGEGLGWFDNL
ncbi:MAG TPA: hypothetical protein VK145_01780 [Candidatus Nanoarchaeia archaeon]|nr:hypothetical protein [Candidatus Nanoarchaeia archaeon]